MPPEPSASLVEKPEMRITAAICLALSLAACHSKPPSLPPATSCLKRADCSPQDVCASGACVPMCTSNVACAAGLSCVAGYCVASICGSTAECGPDLSCQAGTCAPPSGTVASCLLAPALTLLHEGAAGAGLTVLAHDADGAVIPGQVATFAATGAVRIDASGVPTGTGAGPGTLTAQLGSVSCTAQTLSYGAPPADKLRAVVIDQTTGRPLAGAVVALDDLSVNALTDSSGTALLPLPGPGPHDVHAFLHNFTFTSFLGTDSTDLLVPLQPEAWYMRRGYVTGQLGQQDFDKLPNPGAGVHAAIFGVSQSASPLDLSFDAFTGPFNFANLTIGPMTSRFAFGKSLVAGTANGFVADGKYKLVADPGPRIVWGFGANFDATALANAIEPIVRNDPSTEDPSLALARMVPLLDSMQAGALVGAQINDNGAGAVLTDIPVSVPLTVPRKLPIVAEVPDLPADGQSYLPIALVVAGARMGSLGFAPLGLTGGVAAMQGGVRTPKVQDPHCDPIKPAAGCIGNQLPLLLAPESGGLEGSPITLAVAALAQSGAENYLGPGTGIGPGRVAASVLFTTRPAVRRDEMVHVAGPFLPITDTTAGSGAVQFVRSSRTLTLRPDSSSPAQARRFELESNWGHVWRFWVPATARTVRLPLPPANDGDRNELFDPLKDSFDIYLRQGPPTARVFAVQFDDPATSYRDLTSFGPRSLTGRSGVRGYSLASVPLQ